MEKFFNTAGPVIPADHYHISSFKRIDWEEIQLLIAQKRYFILHAPRQTGKTTALLEMMKALNKEGKYHVMYVNIESAQVARNDVEAGISTVCSAMVRAARIYLKEERLTAWLNTDGEKIGVWDRLNALLTHWAEISDKPVVLFIDETDALIGDTLVSLLRQIRAGYSQRPEAFPQCIVLCGVRDLKDYRIHVASGDIITGGSAFNIKSKSLRLGNFTADEMRKLFQQHTHESGQVFGEKIFAEMWHDTHGQPWLVNALGHEMTWEDKSARDRTTPITIERYQAARERLIQSRETHLDQLVDKLREPRVHAIVAALLSGEQSELQAAYDDLQYVEDLGLIRSKPQVVISNRIYREIIPRELTAVTQYTMVQEPSWYLTEENRLDIPKLLAAFQIFFRENSESWIERFDYKEAGPQLLIQAFLQRIINGGGRINREYALGRKRTDLSIEWPIDPQKGFYGKVQKIIIELKIQRGVLESVIAKGLEQTAEYADIFSAEEAHLVIFNRDPQILWDEKIWQQNRQHNERTIVVWGM